MKHIGKTIASICVAGSLLLLIYQCDSQTSITYEELDRPETTEEWMEGREGKMELDGIEYGTWTVVDTVSSCELLKEEHRDSTVTLSNGSVLRFCLGNKEVYEPIHEPRFPNQSSPTL